MHFQMRRGLPCYPLSSAEVLVEATAALAILLDRRARAAGVYGASGTACVYPNCGASGEIYRATSPGLVGSTCRALASGAYKITGYLYLTFIVIWL